MKMLYNKHSDLGIHFSVWHKFNFPLQIILLFFPFSVMSYVILRAS